jgi:hypothetical protein
MSYQYNEELINLVALGNTMAWMKDKEEEEEEDEEEIESTFTWDEPSEILGD